ncbi:MAG: hypothetical protein H0U99_03725 [Chthoniobacterales bacterium]|nr:hypothetical protein [Chthoniobacterales bacterium]
MKPPMKNTCFAVLFLAAVTAHAADNFAVRQETNRRPVRERRVPLTREHVTGVVPRALRGGNPLQMLNPLAPRRYGTAEESVTYKPGYPGKWNGIKLFEIVWY